jgi:Ca-activated chloride channel family protein
MNTHRLSGLFFAALLAAVSLSTAPVLTAQSATDPVRLRVELDRTVLPADTPERTIIKVSLEGARLARPESRPPVNLALVIDRSGSMSGQKIAKAREAALEALDRLAADDYVSVIVFSSGARTLVPAQRVGDGREIAQAIRTITADGDTALYAGVNQGAAELRKHLDEKRYVPRLLLLSDGQANQGPSTPDDLGRLGAGLLKEGISVTTVGLGLDFNEDLMTQLARRSDGNNYFVENSADLPRIFKTELGDVLNVVARMATITVEFPANVRPVRFVGRDGVIRGQTAEVTINQIYGGQEKFALIEAEVVPARAGTEREIARASVRLDDAASGRPFSASAQVRAQFSSDRELVIRSTNLRVQSDYAANEFALAKDRAIELADAGRRAEAAALLRARARELETMGRLSANSVVITISAANAVEADRLERDGLSNSARKTYRNDGANTYGQQSGTRSY